LSENSHVHAARLAGEAVIEGENETGTNDMFAGVVRVLQYPATTPVALLRWGNTNPG